MYVHVLCTSHFVEQTIAPSTMEGVNISAIKEEGATACLGSSCQQMAKAVKVILVSHPLITFLHSCIPSMLFDIHVCTSMRTYGIDTD